MITIPPASRLPPTAGAPLKYRRADVAPADDVADVEGQDEDGDLPSSVPASVTSWILDTWV